MGHKSGSARSGLRNDEMNGSYSYGGLCGIVIRECMNKRMPDGMERPINNKLILLAHINNKTLH
jgi:hypothetical protein